MSDRSMGEHIEAQARIAHTPRVIKYMTHDEVVGALRYMFEEAVPVDTESIKYPNPDFHKRTFREWLLGVKKTHLLLKKTIAGYKLDSDTFVKFGGVVWKNDYGHIWFVSKTGLEDFRVAAFGHVLDDHRRVELRKKVGLS